MSSSFSSSCSISGPVTLTDLDRYTGNGAAETATIIKQQPMSPSAHAVFGQQSRFYPPPPPEEPAPDEEEDDDDTLSTSNHGGDSGARGTSVSPRLNATSSPATNGTQETVPISPEEKRHCAVCNDVASGYHYGVWSCEGCKAFFKRSIQGETSYICPATNTCTIDKHRRKSCQACRLRRCYEVGMTKGTTRRERKYKRKAISVSKITSTSSSTPASSSNHLVQQPQDHSHPSTSQQHSNPLVAPTYGLNPPPSLPHLSVSPDHQQASAPTRMTPPESRVPSSLTPAEFLTVLSQASLLNLPAKLDEGRAMDDRYFLQLLAKVFDQELVVLINWAKAMPGYTESLTLDQQVTIIEQSWLETLLLGVIERSVRHGDDTIHFAPDFTINKQRDLSSPGLSSICQSLFSLLQAFNEPRTTPDEFIALKAVTLINSVPSSIGGTKSFRCLTNQIYQAVQYACDSNPRIYTESYMRHFTLLLQLPHIKTLSTRLIRLFLEMRSASLLPQADLLLEMLDAQDLPLFVDIHSLSLSVGSSSTNGNGGSGSERTVTPATNVSTPPLSSHPPKPCAPDGVVAAMQPTQITLFEEVDDEDEQEEEDDFEESSQDHQRDSNGKHTPFHSQQQSGHHNTYPLDSLPSQGFSALPLHSYPSSAPGILNNKRRASPNDKNRSTSQHAQEQQQNKRTRFDLQCTLSNS